MPRKQTKPTPRSRTAARKRLTPAKQQRGLEAAEIVLAPDAADSVNVAELQFLQRAYPGAKW